MELSVVLQSGCSHRFITYCTNISTGGFDDQKESMNVCATVGEELGLLAGQSAPIPFRSGASIRVYTGVERASGSELSFTALFGGCVYHQWHW